MSHTPGPWRLEHNPKAHPWDGEFHLYAAGSRWSLMGSQAYYPNVPDNADDWRLIAAAPDLLEALKSVVEHFRFTDAFERREVIARADAAIAKAEGK